MTLGNAARFLARGVLLNAIAWWFAGNAISDASYYQLVRHPNPIQVPDTLALVDDAGKPMQLSELRGNYVVLNLWATWCGPCVKELPSLDSLQIQVAKENILVVLISEDKAPKTVVPAYLKKLGIRNLQSYYDPRGTATRAFRAPVLPTTLLLDTEGREIARIIGSLDWSSKEGLQLVRGILRR